MFKSFLDFISSKLSSSKKAVLDFSLIDSQETALVEVHNHRLVKDMLFPKEFGGEFSDQNTVYITEQAKEEKQQLTIQFIRMYEQGLLDKLKVEADYQGNSFVPSTIRMQCFDKNQQIISSPSISVW